jgi:hypothetical protein
MVKKSWGRQFVYGAGRFLFPGDTRHSRAHVQHERLGDQRTRQYVERVDRNTGEVTSGKTRAIRGAEVRQCRQREHNYTSRSKWF